MLLFIIGPSAAGKGTQAELLAKRYHVSHFSVGDILRDEMATGSKQGKIIEEIVNKGNFVPGEIVIGLVEGKVDEACEKDGGAILDGFPRLKSQMYESERLVERHKGEFLVIHYVLSYEECLKRQEARIASGVTRTDDNALLERYNSYKQDIEAIIEYYTNREEYIEIDARPSVGEIFNETVRQIESKIKVKAYESSDKN